MSCVLRVYGRRFDVDAYLRRGTLVPVAVKHRGEPRLPATQPNGPRILLSGCNIVISPASRTDFARQLRGAVKFLKRHARAVRSLRLRKGVEIAVLDFGVERRPEAVVQCETLSEELVALAGRLGLAVEISHYPPSNRSGRESGPRRAGIRVRASSLADE
jgi:hypothetical protein